MNREEMNRRSAENSRILAELKKEVDTNTDEIQLQLVKERLHNSAINIGYKSKDDL